MKEANFKETVRSHHINGIFQDIKEEEEFNFGLENHRDAIVDDKNFTYGHYKVNDGVGTVGGFRIGNKLYYAISICSPKDNFSKTKGRQKVFKNLINTESSKKRGVMILDNSAIDIHPTELLKTVFENFLNRMSHKPTWLKNPIVDFRGSRKVD